MRVKRHLLGWLAATLLFSSLTQAAPLVLATKSFTEQHILSAMTVQYLQKKRLSGRAANQYRRRDFS
ncbi:ABC transporter periplasmic binding protein [Salmonella bongori]|nr:ABC transporter periplasmic binding protein [Salmonella bongori]